jgi:hypothetical protein
VGQVFPDHFVISIDLFAALVHGLFAGGETAIVIAPGRKVQGHEYSGDGQATKEYSYDRFVSHFVCVVGRFPHLTTNAVQMLQQRYTRYTLSQSRL